ncbi:MAG: DUF1566 domain-containing protein [Hyphomicrobiales bacterium]|nr:DUF1566 domain-containing protein [Hyphomicrobiales bacterium]
MLIPASTARADCTNPVATESQIRYSASQNVPMYCNGTDWIAMGLLNPSAGGSGCATTTMGVKPEGHIFYNLDFHVLQYCDGDDWRAVGIGVVGGSLGLSGPSGCANIGDECADTTIFAGYHPITQEHLFIPPTDQEQPGSPGTFTMNWKNATGTNDISTDSTNDGQVNHANRGGAIGDFQAFQACEDLGFGGHSDWYLPSQVELYYLWSVRGTIEAGGNITNFQNAYYWSSTEYSTPIAWSQLFTNGYQSNDIKTNGYRVRCVRR